MMRRSRFPHVLASALSIPAVLFATSALAQTFGSSETVTWSCTGSPCPWGPTDVSHAIVWPDSANPVFTRYGYTTSKGVYLPASVANGTVIHVSSGQAIAYAGQPQDYSHRSLALLTVGHAYTVSGLQPGEVLSVQNASADFEYQYILAQPAPPPPEGSTSSKKVTWTCVGSPCPWGPVDVAHAVVWPADAGATRARYGYSVSEDIYLPASRANGAVITITAGTATAYAGTPDGNYHRGLVTLTVGESYEISDLLEDEVLSVQNPSPFAFQITLPEPPPQAPGTGIINSVNAHWRCDIPGCYASEWAGAVINWDPQYAYTSNARTAERSRSVFSDTGEPLYPYMGKWANGCRVTAVSGLVLIIEWQRGTDVWRETWLNPGESHTISLLPEEDSAIIESYDNSPGFRVSLSNCTPQPLP